ncbi:hypothetical protein ONZ45_g15760 [Pleurotus djamor]|nr:hypothetical protein ONZ45_g15760 [Pleurotus djamor]
MKSAFALAILAATLVAGIGHNNWEQPCFHGECAYDLPTHKEQSGTVKLFAKSPYAIADITPTAGWVVLDCDPNALEQEVRLVCKSDNAEGGACNHLFDGGHGPVGKYVRLPESCSSVPFARVVNYRVHEDQSVPSHHQVIRRDGSVPQVFAVEIDTDFADIDYSKYGDVRFIAYGVNVPGVDTNFAIPDTVDDLHAVGEFLEHASQELVDKASTSRPSSPSSSSPPFIFTRIDAYVTPYYPGGKASTKPYTFTEPAGTKKSGNVNFGSEKESWAKIELKSEDLMCSKSLSSSDKATAKVGVTVTGKIDTYFWGSSTWGGSATGLNGVIQKLTGFWNDLNAHIRHEMSLSIQLMGKVGWENEVGPWAIPMVTGLEFGVANLGLMGALKLEASVTAEAVMEFSGKFQYGLDRGLATVPPKSGKPDNPGFKIEASGFNGSFASTGKAHVAFEAAATPKLLIGASAGSKTSKAKVITSAFLGFETKLTVEAEASKEFASVGGSDSSSRPSSPKSSRPSTPKSPRKSRRYFDTRSTDGDVELGYAVKLGFDAHLGAEAKFWGIGPSGKWSFWTYEYQVACGGSSCSSKSKRAGTTPVSAKTKKLECPPPVKGLKNFLSNVAHADKWKALKKP